MMDFLTIDPSWILDYRTDSLTSFFMTFSQYITYYFYIGLIALGYWLSKHNKPFIHLGFLFPIAVLLNSIIKGILQIPRTDVSLHLIKTYNPYGFPSGDALLATVFWGTLFVFWKNSRLRYLCLLPIVLISSSRVYLGAYSLYDVLGGILLGALIVYLFNRKSVQDSVEKWYGESKIQYWIAVGATTAAYVLVYRHRALDPFFFSFIGLLIGYGISLPWIERRDLKVWPNYTIESYMNLIIAGIILYSAALYTNVSAISMVPEVNYLCVTLKYALLSLGIFALVPKLMKTAKHKK